MTSKQKIVDDRIKNYILTCIDSDCYGVETVTVGDKIDFLMNCFKNEYGFKNEYSETAALKEWFQGLPSTFNCVFYNRDTYNLGVKLGFLNYDCSDKQVEKWNKNYWHLLATKTLQLSRNKRLTIQIKEKQNIKVYFDDDDFLITSINATENDTLKYYVNESFLVNDKTSHKCTHIKFLSKGII